ncbi:RHS repeat domain-containing protein [Tenacibaculum singaporense]|uniref:RHS repeat domain-containing protein n=1 Tax=Tenacibaculum singaporense TaxID=2358479 RepID=UPI000F68F65B|nr:RHS repeat domain-containing protein [Tenacibaculum singaporense]RSC92197.1 hypothetical protein EI424_14250 [Tenacibaculum singaporense]
MLFCVWGYAQDLLPKIVPPSPEAASLIKHAQVGVSLYTGTPNISIPFYTISSNGVSIPINLTYNSGGVQVEDIASWVGTGWNLNPGGLITRTMRGLPDDKPTYGYMYTQYTVEDLLSRDPESMDPNGQTYHLKDMADARDYEPDVFNFNFPGGTGRFYYDQSLDKFVQVPYSNLNIETKKEGGRLVGFKITTPEGVAYHFGKSSDNLREGLERIVSSQNVSLTPSGFSSGETQTYGTASSPYFQAWMLMDIVYPISNDQIKFYYSVEQGIKTTQRVNEKFVVALCTNGLTINFQKKEFTQPKIASIEFPEGKIVFEKGATTRLDLLNSKPLQYIKLYDTQNTFIKGLELITSMEQVTSVNSPFDYYDEGKYRLQLNAVKQVGANSNELNPYTFEYHSTKLPDRYSKSMDYFGFYNGKSNPSLIARHKYGTLGYIGNADRAVDPTYTQAGTLTKIIYPTGGYDSFIWDNNYVSVFEGNASNYIDHLTKITEYLTNSILFEDSDPSIDYSKTFTIPNNSDGLVSFSSSMTGCGPTFNYTSCDYVLKVKGVTNPNFSLSIINPNFEYTFAPGTYKVTAVANSDSSGEGGGCDPLTDPTCLDGGGSGPGSSGKTFSVTMNYTTDPTPDAYIYGGLRIAQINTYESTGKLAMSRSFNYDSFEVPGNVSSGVSIGFPDFLNPYYFLGGMCPEDEGLGKEIYSTVGNQLELTKGGYAGYKNVTETYTGGTDNGKKRYTFSVYMGSFDNPYPTNYYENPYPNNFKTPIYRDWLRGNLVKLEFFDGENQLVNKEETSYETVSTYHSPYFGVETYKNPGGMGVALYSYSTEWHRLKSKKNTSYLPSGNLVTTQNYIYNSNELLPSEVTTINSKGEILKTKNYYAPDITTVSSLGHDNLTTTEKAAIDQLKLQNRIVPPVQVETFKDNVLYSAQRTTYNSFNGLYLPEIIQTSKGSQSLEDRLVYHSYDNKGNPTEVSKANGTHIVYIWGYNDSHPIAKIENAKLSDIPSTYIDPIKNASNLDDDRTVDNRDVYGTIINYIGKEGQLRFYLNKLHQLTALNNSKITFYTYDPLIGVTSITDPRGQTVYYQYDEFNRLEFVKDAKGNILKEHKHNYKN